MQTLSLIAALAILSVASCASDQYSATPFPTGPWTPANADMANNDNNLVPRPLTEAPALPLLGPATATATTPAPVTGGAP